jgi:hypothetical protein
MTAALALRTAPVNKTRGEEAEQIVRLRPRELRSLFRRRHGQTFPADDVGRRDAAIVLDHYVALGENAYRQMTIFLDRSCPWMPPAERAAASERAFQQRKFWSKTALGNTLGLTWEEREDCDITTFRPAGATDADMVTQRKKRKAARNREQRREATLHPKKEEASLPEIRARVVAGILRPGERCTVTALCAELKRVREIRFASLKDAALKTAVHAAINFGVAQGFLKKDFERGVRTQVAWVSKARPIA